MDDKEERRLWTVAQAVVWIRTRDRHQVDAHHEGEDPVEKSEQEIIRTALGNGALIAFSQGVPIEQDFWRGRGGAVFNRKGDRANTLHREFGGIVLDAQHCMRIWPAPSDLLGHNSYSLRSVLDRLSDDIRLDAASVASRRFLTRPSVLVTGLNSVNERIEVDELALREGVIHAAERILSLLLT